MTSLALASALQEYELAIASGASSLDLAVLFADLTAAHRAHVTRIDEEEHDRCPSVCTADQARWGYVEGSRCMARAGHSTYRNVVGHLFALNEEGR